MTLADFLEVKTDERDIDLGSEVGYIGFYSKGKIYEEKYLESKVLKFYCGFDSVIDVTIEEPKNLVNINYEENWGELLGISIFLRDGSAYRVIREETLGDYFLLNTETYKMWALEQLANDPDFENELKFFEKEDDPYFMGVEVR